MHYAILGYRFLVRFLSSTLGPPTSGFARTGGRKLRPADWERAQRQRQAQRPFLFFGAKALRRPLAHCRPHSSPGGTPGRALQAPLASILNKESSRRKSKRRNLLGIDASEDIAKGIVRS